MHTGKRARGDAGQLELGPKPVGVVVKGPKAAGAVLRPGAVGAAGPKVPLPTGEVHRQSPQTGGCAGYVFICGQSAQADSMRLGILGAPIQELAQMKSSITPDTQLFLFNVETFQLIGRFVATGPPERDLAPGAFGGVFGAQVPAAPLDLSSLEVAVDDWVVPGPRSAADVQALNARLRKGQVAAAQMQAVKEEPQEAAPPARKRQRVKMEQLPGRVAPAAPGVAMPVAALPGLAMPGFAMPAQYAGPSICWDLAKGKKCPRGLQCRYCHGYVFSCNNATQSECQERRLFGAPERDLAVIQACVRQGSELLLFNFESSRLFGPFAAASAPGPRLVKEAFGGKFSAHVRASLRPDAPLLEASVESRVSGGPKTAAELDKLKQLLAERGTEVEDDVRLVWATAGIKEEPAEEGGSPDSMFCWDFAKGSCPRGAKCKYLHLEGEAAAYVFLCNSKTQADCSTFRLLGSPAKELRQMKHCIRPDTQLFLLNFETLALIGPFVGISTPELDINREAYGGKFSAQICVEPLEAPLLQAVLPERLRAGPKSAAELEQLREKLEAGGVAPDDIQNAWMQVEEAEAT